MMLRDMRGKKIELKEVYLNYPLQKKKKSVLIEDYIPKYL